MILENEAVCVCLPVGGNKDQVVNSGEGFAQASHVAGKLALEVPNENPDTSHNLVERQTINIPSAGNEAVGVNHMQHVTERNFDVIASDRVDSQIDSGSAEDISDVVRLLDTSLGVPDNVVPVDENGSGEYRASVSSNAYHHQPEQQN